MPKFKKKQVKTGPKLKKKQSFRDIQAYRTIKISAALGGIFLVISFLFNASIITFFESKYEIILNEIVIEEFVIDETVIDIYFILNTTIKVSAILLTFLFFIISLGNFKDLTGKPVNWKEILLLVVLSLIQAIRNPLDFIIAFLGLFIILFYLYLVQAG